MAPPGAGQPPPSCREEPPSAPRRPEPLPEPAGRLHLARPARAASAALVGRGAVSDRTRRRQLPAAGGASREGGWSAAPGWCPEASLAPSLTALTALVVPACSVRPVRNTAMPGMSSAFDPSMSSPIRPSRYGGVQTTAPITPPPALAGSFAPFEETRRLGLAPLRPGGTAT